MQTCATLCRQRLVVKSNVMAETECESEEEKICTSLDATADDKMERP